MDICFPLLLWIKSWMEHWWRNCIANTKEHTKKVIDTVLENVKAELGYKTSTELLKKHFESIMKKCWVYSTTTDIQTHALKE